MRWMVCAAVWLLVNAAALVVASQTKFGPTLLTVSSRHGVHLGDLLAVLAGVTIASGVTVVLWVTAPEHPPTQVVVMWVLVAVVWQLCFVVSLLFVASVDLGPVIASRGRRRVHLGDVVVVLGGVAVASLLTALVANIHPRLRAGRGTLGVGQHHSN